MSSQIVKQDNSQFDNFLTSHKQNYMAYVNGLNFYNNEKGIYAVKDHFDMVEIYQSHDSFCNPNLIYTEQINGLFDFIVLERGL